LAKKIYPKTRKREQKSAMNGAFCWDYCWEFNSVYCGLSCSLTGATLGKPRKNCVYILDIDIRRNITHLLAL
jgi:hypothetical protein